VTKRRAYRRQEPPLSISLELSEGCNLYCNFCGLQGIREQKVKNYKFMERETLVRVVEQVRDLGWNCRVGFAMRGEPTMHPDYVGMIGAVRDSLPRATILMLTNSGGLLRKPGPVANVTGLFDAGLNVLGLDDYEGVGLVPKVLEALSERGELRSGGATHPLGFAFYKYPQEPAGNPHVRVKRGTRMLVQIRDISVTDSTDKKGNHNRLSNHAGAGGERNERMAGSRCALPFRQMAVRFDGNVPLCCNDWRGEYRCGSVLETPLDDIWQSAAMGAAREMLIRGKRVFKPCLGCDHRSFRVGLLPDLKGQGRVHLPDAQTTADVSAAIEDGPMTQPVLRPWEKPAC
jgi:hypothetical protein